MKLTSHSRSRLMQTFANWHVPKDFAGPMYNYLVHGYSPGSCFTAALANDFAGAILRSHPSNTIEALKALTGWMRDTMPRESYGSYETVNDWCYLTCDARRTILEKNNLVFSSEQEIVKILKDEPVREPVLY